MEQEPDPNFAAVDEEATITEAMFTTMRQNAHYDLGLVGRFGDIAMSFLEIGDDKGAIYAVRKVSAHLKAVKEAIKTLPGYLEK